MWFRAQLALIALVLVGFVYKLGVVLTRFGYLGFFEVATSNAVVLQFFLDLVICLSLIFVWIYVDARKLGISPWPFIAIGALFGAVGPLAYVLRRPLATSGRNGVRELPIPFSIAAAVLALFGVFSLVVLMRSGYMTFAFYAGANDATELLFYDLAISAMFVSVLVVRDARARGASWGPFLPIAILFGGLAPLFYLVTRGLPRWGQRLVGWGGLGLALFMTTLGKWPRRSS